MSEILDLTHKRLGWPSRGQIMNPAGAGPNVIAKTANAKIGSQIRNIENAIGAEIGVLAANPFSDSTEAPLAIVCEFPKPVFSDKILIEAQRLAWNFSWSPQLIVVEPHLIRSFTCCQSPAMPLPCHLVSEVPADSLRQSSMEQAAQALHWVKLVSGEFFRTNQKYFRRDRRADHMLLDNLRDVRHKLVLKQKKNEDL
ncbi:MAG: hypothetical protein ABIH23_09355 [bacterium]